MKVVVTGVAGKLGLLVAQRLLAAGHEVIGIDRRPWPGMPEGATLCQVDIRKRAAEDVFRIHRPDAAIHMATVTHIKKSTSDRYKINLLGTRAVFDHCNEYGTKAAIFVGRHTYYGAAPDAPLYHKEDDPPMAVNSFPELSDLVAADLYAGSSLWRYPKVATSVLRVCYTLGPGQHGTLASFLRGPYVPMVLGYDPLFQYMHEHDVAAAICLALEKQLRGVFNVAGPPPLPLSVLVKQTGSRVLPVPEPLFRLALGRFGLPKLPKGALEHVKYPVVINTDLFREATGFEYIYDEDQTIEAFNSSRR